MNKGIANFALVLLVVMATIGMSARASEIFINHLLEKVTAHTFDDAHGETLPPPPILLAGVLDEMMTFDSPVLRADPALRAQWHEIIDALIAYRDDVPEAERWRRVFTLDAAVQRFGRPHGPWRHDEFGQFVGALYADMREVLITLDVEYEIFARTRAGLYFADRSGTFAKHVRRARRLPLAPAVGGPAFVKLKTALEDAATKTQPDILRWSAIELVRRIHRWRKQTAPRRVFCMDALTNGAATCLRTCV